MNISNKLFLPEVVELLEWEGKPIDYAMHVLINERHLPAYFDVNVEATEAEGYSAHQINQEGDELFYVDGQPPESIEGDCKKILEYRNEGNGLVSINRFEHEGKRYCGSDDEGVHLKPIMLESKYIYFDKTEIRSVGDLPPYQDKQHEYYALELDLAIQLHKAIIIDNYRGRISSRVTRVDSWLNENYAEYEFSNVLIERLSTVIGKKALKLKK